jgi:FkbM family methyltransferase
VRRAAGAVIGGVSLRVRSGPNRGRRWSIASAGRGALAGRFEEERVSAILELLRPGDCVWDIGAHKGYITMAAAGRVGAAGHVNAFEPAPPNLDALRRHVRWNQLSNVDVLPYAISADDGTSRFGGPGSSITYRLGQGEYDVTVRTIRSLLEQGVRPPALVKIDVEGNEAQVLRGAAGALPRDSLVFIAVHSLEQYNACTAILKDMGWNVLVSPAVARILSHSPVAWRADPDILAVGPDRVPDASRPVAFTAPPPEE